MFILEFNSEMEIIKEAGPYIKLTAFTLNENTCHQLFGTEAFDFVPFEYSLCEFYFVR